MTKQGLKDRPKANVRPSIDADNLEVLPAMMRQRRAVGSEASRRVIREHFAEVAECDSVAPVMRNRVDKDADTEASPDLDSRAAVLETESSTAGKLSPAEIRDVVRDPGGVTRHGCLGIKPGEFEPSGNPARRPWAIPGDTLAKSIDSAPTVAIRG
jgi:hypothetical protein